MLIALNGLLQSGKDTTYAIIRDLYPHAERLAFADKLKVSAAAALGCSVETVERLKVDEDVVFVLQRGYQPGGPIDLDDIQAFSIREFLQRYGTEAHRDVFGDDFWVKQALPDGFDHLHRIVCVTDCRFANEAARIHELGGCVVEIIRPNCRPRLPSSNGHTSESGIGGAADYRIVNDGTLDDLHCKVKAMMVTLIGRYTDGYEVRKLSCAEPLCF